MGNIYRLTVIKVGKTEDTDVFELGGSAAMIMALVGDAINVALSEFDDDQAPEQPIADRVWDAATGPAEAPSAPDGPRPRRPRRTKAQMEADAAAAAAATQGTPTATVTPITRPAVPVEVPAEAPSGVLGENQPAWNPFATKQ